MSKYAVLSAICLAILCHRPCGAQTPSVTVNASANQGTISPFVYGHSHNFLNVGSGLWDASTRSIKAQAKPLIQAAVQQKAVTIRFPGGHASDYYRWRRGVGPLTPVNLRPQIKDYYGTATGNEFGTDEFAAFCDEIDPNVEAMMTANWWDFNKPSRFDPNSPDYDPQAPEKGRQEAANFVEYCNGILTQEDLNLAVSEDWQPTVFCDPDDMWDESPPAFFGGVTAVEWADSYNSDGTPRPNPTCWRSYEVVPPVQPGGQRRKYFAWLRYHFAQLRGESDPGPYGFRYWEIGTEVPGHFWRTDANLGSDEADTYRNSITGTADPYFMGWCEALKRANSADGGVTIASSTVC